MKQVIFTTILLVLCTNLYADFAVDSTRTMDSTHVSAIRTAFSGGSEIGEFYWEHFYNYPIPRQGIEDSLMAEDGRWLDYFNADLYVKEAIWGAVGLDIPEDETDSLKLDLARDYLLDPLMQNAEHYLDLDVVWDSLGAGHDAGTNMWFGFITRNVAIMVDMLWNYVDSTERDSMCARLDSLADSLHFHLDRLKNTWGTGKQPQFFQPHFYASALGLAGCVLGNTTYINFAKDLIFDFQVPYTEEPQNGYLDLFTTGEYYIGEGLSYFGCNNLTQLSLYFTTYLRMYDENLYEEDIIHNIMNKFSNMIRPDMLFLTLDDCFNGKYNYSNPVDEYYLLGIYEYYYNNTSCENDNSIRWYFNEFTNKYCDGDEYPSLACWDRDFHAVYSYNPNKMSEINSTYSFPQIISEGSYSDKELTIMRPATSTQQQYEQSNALYVNYDNSLDPSWHEHGDQTSYQLFAKGKYLIIDPGYLEGDAIHKLDVSPFMHSLIIINPDESNPSSSEPINRDRYTPGDTSTVHAPNPSFKEHFINDDSIEKLKIYMDYIDDPNGDDTVRVERNYYSFNNVYYVIYDNVIRFNGTNSDSIWNTIHFAPYTGANDYLTWNSNGEFIFDKYQETTLYGLIGSVNDYEISVSTLPTGILNDDPRSHSRLEIKTNGVETSFITLLYPSESATNPITDIIDGDSYYAVEIYDASKQPVEKSYYAVSDSLLDISFNDIDINSDAAFVGLTYRPGYQFATKVTKFIMAEGDILFYNDNDTLLVDPNSSIDEVIATYSGTELSVIVVSDDEYPQYRILRQEVEPDNFTSIGVANKENGTSNIKHLSYDSDYFYVNWYDFSTSPVYLTTSVLVPYGDTLVIGNGVTINCMNSDIKIEIEGEISIGDGVTFTSPDSVGWDGLYLLNTSAEIIMNNVTFERGNIVCESRFLVINNSDFTNTGIVHHGYQLTVNESEFSGCGIYCNLKSMKVTPALTEINISNCSFSDYYSYPIFFSNYNYYELYNNTISQCNGGFIIYESGNKNHCTISNNIIENNSYGQGIRLYHSHADIIGHNRVRENSYGIIGANKSSITMIGNDDYPCQIVYDNIHEEIVIDQSSYPEKLDFNIIRDDNYDYGTSDQYLIRCARFDGEERSLNAENNNWGYNSLYWNEWDGDDRFDPATAFDYIPVWDPGTPRDNGIEEAELLYAEADSLIEEEEYEDAKTTYQSIIDLYTLTDYAMYSMRNLLSMETISGNDFSSIRGYYLTDPNCNINEERTKLSQYLANYCTIKMEQYPEAISFFENIISDPDTELDSVYAVIDAGYTYLLMENGGKSDYVGKMAELKPKSEKEFRIMRDDLLSELFEIIETEQEEPNVEYVFELKHNYPNPFNSKTTISFSLPLSTQKAELKIYNIRGQLVRELALNMKSGIGSISWDGLDSYGKKVGSGIYLYKLIADKKEIVKKMVLMR